MKNYWLEKAKLQATMHSIMQCWDWHDFVSPSDDGLITKEAVEKFNERVREVVKMFKATSIAASPEIMSLWFYPSLTLKQPINMDILIYKNDARKMLILNYSTINSFKFDPIQDTERVFIVIKNLTHAN